MNGRKLYETLPESSWLRDWLNVWPTTEAPVSYVLFSGLSTIGACLGRSTWFNHDVHTLFPMLNILLIGPSGIGKSTSIKMGQFLVKNLPNEQKPQIIMDSASPEKLHSDLAQNPHAIVYASELATFFTKQKYMESMIPYCTRLLDYDDTVSRRTFTRDLVVVDRPSVTIQGGSTVEWLQEQLPPTAGAGGFLARFLIVYEEYKRQRIAFPGLALDRAKREKLREYRSKTFDRFYGLVTKPKGEIRLRDFGVNDVYTAWYLNYKAQTGALSPFAARAPEFVLRLSMLLAVSSERMEIVEEDVRAAITLYEYCAAKLQKVVIPFTPQGKLLAQVLQAVGNEERTRQEIRRAMRNSAKAQDVESLIVSLISSGDLVELKNGHIAKSGGNFAS